MGSLRHSRSLSNAPLLRASIALFATFGFAQCGGDEDTGQAGVAGSGGGASGTSGASGKGGGSGAGTSGSAGKGGASGAAGKGGSSSAGTAGAGGPAGASGSSGKGGGGSGGGAGGAGVGGTAGSSGKGGGGASGASGTGGSGVSGTGGASGKGGAGGAGGGGAGGGGAGTGGEGGAGSGGEGGAGEGGGGRGGSPGSCAPTGEVIPPLTLTPIVTQGLGATLLVKGAPGDSTRLYVVEQGGRIRIIKGGVLQPTDFLDLSGAVVFGGEQGLLGLAFHPGFATNGRFFVHYSGLAGGLGGQVVGTGDTVIAEYSATPDAAEPASAQLVLTVVQPEANHNGGSIEFSPVDGMLYIALGDGGGGGDAHGTIGNGQDLTTLLGKILRVDVASLPYTIPSGNMTGSGVRPEIWDFGLRNPWRMSFDSCDGALYIGDVGQSEIEEINVEPAGSGNRNYGWRMKEGPQCYEAPPCDPGGLTDPVAWYDHSAGVAITGGYVYRGTKIPGLAGTYFYGDFNGPVSSFQWDGTNSPQTVTPRPELFGGISLGSFGQGSDGEVYLVDLGGGIYRIDAK